MALGTQLSPTQTLVTFCLWARRHGYDVGEMHGFSAVHPVHTGGSWHFDSDAGFGKAADINKNGPDERAELIEALNRAQELGLGVIFARDGSAGVSGSHKNHLHVDVGPFGHLGAGSFQPRGGGDVLTEAVQRAVRAAPDQVWGPDTDMRVEAVKAASNLMGVQFPQGVEFTQRVVGVADDGVWGQASRRAHDVVTAAIQRALGRPANGTWDAAMVVAYSRARDLRSRA
ncbi:hypothetical protein [Cellulomonas humilata]|uniref:Peptidase M15A C-terminal domain-containing protein n=1 Tax=Cellulomonas humilata TaxID=144055 RepID=A0ABU0E9W1_9CELL|nr:hypothetical protein [Cellulomonas humilata]MDQ0372046.1 hypothetical protein [Cellulomonas humilata]